MVGISFRLRADKVQQAQISLGNGDFASGTFALVQSDDANAIITPTSEWKEYNYILSGSFGRFSQIVLQVKQGDGTLWIDDLNVTVQLAQNQQIIIPKDAIGEEGLSAHVSTTDCVYGDMIAYNVYGYAKSQSGEWVTGPVSGLMPVMMTYPDNSTDGIRPISYPPVKLNVTGSQIEVTKLSDETVSVYDISGTEIFNDRSREEHVNVHIHQPGIYIVKVGDCATKVSIR